MQYNNPVERLLTILKQGKEVKGDTSTGRAWDILLDVEDDLTLRMNRLAKFYALVEEVCSELSKLENYEQEVLPIIENLNLVLLNNNLHSHWSNFINRVDATTLSGLAIFKKLIDDDYNSDLNFESLLEIKKQLGSILNSIISSNEIEESLRVFLVRSIRGIITSIEEYHLTGIVPISDALNAALGNSFVDSRYKDFLSQNQTGQALVEVFAVLANITTVLVGVPQVGLTIQALLGKN